MPCRAHSSECLPGITPALPVLYRELEGVPNVHLRLLVALLEVQHAAAVQHLANTLAESARKYGSLLECDHRLSWFKQELARVDQAIKAAASAANRLQQEASVPGKLAPSLKARLEAEAGELGRLKEDQAFLDDEIKAIMGADFYATLGKGPPKIAVNFTVAKAKHSLRDAEKRLFRGMVALKKYQKM